ncbi:hypothetical protein ACJX0J_005964, partial [Zea mays]
ASGVFMIRRELDAKVLYRDQLEKYTFLYSFVGLVKLQAHIYVHRYVEKMQNEKLNFYASASDSRPVLGDVTYYGRIIDIIELNCSGNFIVLLIYFIEMKKIGVVHCVFLYICEL